MIIVKMNNTAVECNIAASELQEMGLTPEGIGAGDMRSSAFMSQLNKEIGAQLGFDPKTDILMMSKNMMNDGSLRVFVMKMSNDDIQSACERMRAAAEGVIKHVASERVEEIVNSEGAEKSRLLGEILGSVMNELAGIVIGSQLPAPSEEPEVTTRPAVEYARYLTRLPDLRTCMRLSKALTGMPVVDSALYKQDGDYYMTFGVSSNDERAIFDLRRVMMDYAEDVSINSPEEFHISENAETLIAKDAMPVLSEL